MVRKTFFAVLLLMALAVGQVTAADYYFDLSGMEIQVSEATAAKATIYYEVGTSEAQTITVSKAGGAYGVTGGSTAAQVDGTVYKLVIHADDIDTEGFVSFLSTGATDAQYLLNIVVVDHDPFDDIKVAPANYLAAGSLATDSLTAAALKTDAVDEIVDAAWDELLSGHTGAGSFGKSVADTEADATLIVADTGTDGVVLKAAGLDTDAVNEIVDQVWDETMSEHVGAGSTGKGLTDVLADTGTDGVVIVNDGITAAKIATDAFTNDEFAATGVAEIVDATWDELTSGHTNAGSFGKAVGDGLDTAATADAVWDEAMSGHTGAGSAGKAVADVLDDTGTSGVALGAGVITSTVMATDSITSDEVAGTAATEIAAAVAAESRGIYHYEVQQSEGLSVRRTLYFRALGTLPANASISKNGGAFANSTNAPGTVNGNFRKLVLTKAEVSANARLMINVTTTGTVHYVVIIVDVVDYDPFTEGAVTKAAARRGFR